MELSNKIVLILGAGKTGISCAKFLSNKCKLVLLSDLNIENESFTKKELKGFNVSFEFGENSDKFIDKADLVIASPGIPPQSEVIKKIISKSKLVISDIELASYFIKKPIIGITGTNGKTTTTSLVTHILQAAKKNVACCGNIGTPIFDLVSDGDSYDFYVVELSSYQLHYSPTLSCHIAGCTNITPDHIDWHNGFENYIEAKRKLFSQQKNNSWAILNLDDKHVKEFSSLGEILYTSLYETNIEEYKNIAYIKNDLLHIKLSEHLYKLVNKNDLQILGDHNLENALIASSICMCAGINKEEISLGLKTFTGVEHRLEHVPSKTGKEIFNDSKATNPEATIKAIQALASSKKGKKITLIAGGRDKNTDLKEMVEIIKKDICNVILFGEAKARFEEALKKYKYNSDLQIVDSLNAAVSKSLSSNTDIILFSPACASFDMFKNYEERGTKFKELIRSI